MVATRQWCYSTHSWRFSVRVYSLSLTKPMVATRQWCYLTHSWGRYWWASGRVHTPVGPAHCTSGATYCSEISSTLAWGRKVPSVRGVPREGSTRVLSVERLCTSREDLRTLLPFRPRAIWRLRLKARARGRSYTLLYSTCSTSRITHFIHMEKFRAYDKLNYLRCLCWW